MMNEQDKVIAACVAVNIGICVVVALAVMVTKSAAPLFGLLCMMSYKHKGCDGCGENQKGKGGGKNE